MLDLPGVPNLKKINPIRCVLFEILKYKTHYLGIM
jgi:hypothetical protein